MSASTSPTACARAARGCLMPLMARGTDITELLRRHGLTPDILTDPYARIAHPQLVELWSEAPRLCEDVDFGLHAAEASHRLAFDALDQATQNCATIGDAVVYMVRFIRLLHDSASIRRQDDGALCRLTWHFDCEPRVPRPLLDFILGRWVLRLRQCSSQSLPLREIGFSYPQPSSIAEHHRLFLLSPRFALPHCTLVFDRQLLDHPLPNPNPALRQIMERHIHDLLQTQPGLPDLLQQARRCISERLPEGAPDLKKVARSLGTSNRSLQRRLGECGTSFQEVVDTTRRDLALRHLRDPQLSLTEVAFLTGFTDVSAFHRAFRRWTGKTPREHRIS